MAIRKFLTALLVSAFSAAQAAPPPPPATAAEVPARLKRADSFLGIHFDFHAGPDCTEIGRNTTPAMVENIINLVHPDYLQIDCKGHRGLSSYPTKVGNQAPGFVGDPLRVWREVTARRGVSLYMHYSGVWDSEAIIKHPPWGVINAGGKTNPNATSFFGPYADQLLIPQLRELAGEYGVDGAWVDGECWASVPDYSPAALTAFREKTGITEVPRKPGDPQWLEFLEFHRGAFRQYLRHYVTEVKRTHPKFEICSNWAYTDHMAEAVNTPVDYLSGDYSPEDSVNSARLSARFLVGQKRPWDLMAWSFSRNPGKAGGTEKTAVQLQREAAVVVALGGGFQAYFKQTRDGSINPARMPVMAEVAAFCRARQAVCHRAVPVPQVALVLSTAGHYRKLNGLFNRDLGCVSGTLQALLESQHSVEVVSEHMLAGRMSEYPLIVVPEWAYLEPRFRDELTAYAKGGGNLLLVGVRTAALFQAELGVTMEQIVSEQSVQLGYQSAIVALKGETQRVQPAAGVQVVGELQPATAGSTPQPAATIARLGQGKIAVVWFSLSQSYPAARGSVLRQFTRDLARQLVPAPLVEVSGSPDVDVSVARNHGKLLVNLVNTAGPHQSEPIIDTIPAVGPLEVVIRQAKKPVRVTLDPGNHPLAFEYRDGQVHLTIGKIDIHEVVVVESN